MQLPRRPYSSDPVPSDLVRRAGLLFEVYPYLLTLIRAGLNHLIPLPRDRSREQLRSLLARQWEANRLPTALVLGPTDCIVLSDEGPRADDGVPFTRWMVCDRLQPPEEFPEDAELAARRKAARGLSDATRQNVYLMGNLLKNGRRATEQELRCLAGFQEGNVPRGLTRCPACRQWRGLCLDPDPMFAGMVMPVHCLCDNHNRCARCGGPLANRRLGANEFNETDGMIWHTPTFSCLSHRCPPAGSGGPEVP